MYVLNDRTKIDPPEILSTGRSWNYEKEELDHFDNTNLNQATR